MATDDTGIPKDPSSEKGKQSSNLPQELCNVRDEGFVQETVTHDTSIPKDLSSQNWKQSSMRFTPAHPSNIGLVKVGQGINISPHLYEQISKQPQQMRGQGINVGQGRNIGLGTSSSPIKQHPNQSGKQNFNPKNKIESLVEDLIQISKPSSNQNSWKISKVPHRLRYVNEKAYEPRVISIGPYNLGKEHLTVMEIIKERSLNRILRENKDRASEFVKAMKAMEQDVRKRYSEDLDRIDSYTFVKMMIIDGCFIVDLFQNKHRRKEFWEQDGILTDIYYDLLLLENQLPFSVLSKLYGIIKMSSVEMDEFARLAQMDEFVRLAHLAQMVEFARLAFSCLKNLVPGPVIFPKRFSENIKDLLDIKHLLGLVHDSWILPLKRVEGQGTLPRFIPCARELKDAGIKFVKIDNDDHIDFTDDATLKIPTIKIDDNTELIFRNFMAFEQSILIWEPMYVCDYVEFMDNLIDSDKDVQLLRHSGVLVNSLSDYEMFNKLRDSTYTSELSFCYKKIYDAVDKHCQRKLNKWRAKILKKVRCFFSIITCRQAGK